MTRLLPSALITILFALGMTMAQYASAKDQLLDKVIAMVNEQIILNSELSQKMFEQAQAMAAQGIEVEDTEALRQKVLDALILETLQLERAKQLGLNASDEEINQQLSNLAKKNNLTLFELRNQLNLQAPNGFQTIRAQFKNQILIQKLREKEVISQAYVTESEIQNYLQRQALANSKVKVNLLHILISLPESATPQQRQSALKHANEIKQRIHSGESFTQLAVRHSEGSNALQGGDLGWMAEDEVPTFFADAITTLEEGQVSDVIESPSGFHLVKLAAKEDRALSEIKTEYHLHRFIILSDDSSVQEIPRDILKHTQEMDSMQDFQSLFSKFPDIPLEMNSGSDLGWRALGQLPEAIRTDIANMAVKTAMPPLRVNEGWMILYLDDIREVNQANETQRQQAIQTIRLRKANEMFDLWLLRMKDEAFIQYL